MLQKLFPWFFVPARERRRQRAMKYLEQAAELEPTLRPFVDEFKRQIPTGRIYGAEELERRRQERRTSKK